MISVNSIWLIMLYFIKGIYKKIEFMLWNILSLISLVVLIKDDYLGLYILLPTTQAFLLLKLLYIRWIYKKK